METNDLDNNLQELKNCIPCMEGKMAAKPFPSKDAHRASQPLELIHTDVCGPMPATSWGGAKYLVTYTDDFTRKSFGYLLQRKNEMLMTSITALAVRTRPTHRARRSMTRSLRG